MFYQIEMYIHLTIVSALNKLLFSPTQQILIHAVFDNYRNSSCIRSLLVCLAVNTQKVFSGFEEIHFSLALSTRIMYWLCWAILCIDFIKQVLWIGSLKHHWLDQQVSFIQQECIVYQASIMHWLYQISIIYWFCQDFLALALSDRTVLWLGQTSIIHWQCQQELYIVSLRQVSCIGPVRQVSCIGSIKNHELTQTSIMYWFYQASCIGSVRQISCIGYVKLVSCIGC